MPHNWGMISNGATFEALVQSLLFFEKPGTLLFGRPGKDSGQDARSADGETVYQAKFHKDCSMDTAVSDALSELEKIREYRQPDHNNHKHWKNAKTWVLASNFSINPNDHQKWVDKVIPEFSKEGLSAEYWPLDEVEAMLSRHPYVADNFFTGLNRNFLSLNEAYRSVTSENFGELMYSVREMGREIEAASVGQFLENEQKSILPIIGFGGVGKTRFLYERGIECSNEGWRVFWANTETMTDSADWFKGITIEDRVLVLANEPDDPKFIYKCIEQLGANARANWKIIVTVRSPNDPVIRSLNGANARGSRVENRVNLFPLHNDVSKELIQALNPAITGVNVEQLSIACEGYPVWIGLAVHLIREEGSTRSLPQSSKGLVDHYLREIERNHNTSLCDTRCLRSVLQWVALFKTCNSDNSILLNFIARQSGVSAEQITGLLQNLTERQALRNWGVNKRLYAIKPDVIRDHILRRWLIDETSNSPKPSHGARQLVELLLSDDRTASVPNIDTVLTQIARTEYMNLDGGVRILEPIFEELQRLASSDSVLMQRQVVHLATKIGFSSPEDVIDTLSVVVDNVTDSESVTDDLWGKFEVTHKQVVDDIPQALYDLVPFISTRDEAIKLFGLFRIIFMARYAPKGDWDHTRVPEHDILQSLINRYGISDVLTDEIIACCDGYVEQLKGDQQLSEAEFTFAKLVLGSFLNIERRSSESAGMTMYLQNHLINPDSALGKEIFRIRSILKEVICVSPVIPHRTMAWDIIASTNSAMNRGVGVKTKPDDMAPWQQRLRAEYESDMVWCLQVLEIEKDNMSMADWSAARELWDWDVKYSDHDETKKLAEQCEGLYKAAPVISEFQLGELFDWDKYGEERSICKEIASHILETGIDALVRFIDAVDLYVSTKKRTSTTKSYGVAHLLGEQIGDNPFVLEYVQSILPEDNSSESHFNFAMEIIRAEVLILRGRDNVQAVDKLRFYADLVCDKILFVSRYYWNPHPLNIGIPTIDDVEFFKELDLTFDPNHRYEKHFDVAGVLFFWEPCHFTEIIKEWWDTLDEDIKKKSISARTFIHSLHLTWLRYEDHTELTIPEDLLVTITDLAVELPAAEIMFSMDLASLCKKRCLYLTLTQFNMILRKRIELSKQDMASQSDFQAMPFEFDAKAWVKFDPDADESELYRLIELSLMPTFLAYEDIPKYAKVLDEDSQFVPQYIKQQLDLLWDNVPSDVREITKWSRFAGYYDNDSSEWRIIAVPTCGLASKLPKKNRVRVFCSLNPTNTGVRSSSVGSVDLYYEEEVEKAKTRLENETEASLLSYRKWMLDVSMSELEWARGRAEEDFGND